LGGLPSIHHGLLRKIGMGVLRALRTNPFPGGSKPLVNPRRHPNHSLPERDESLSLPPAPFRTSTRNPPRADDCWNDETNIPSHFHLLRPRDHRQNLLWMVATLPATSDQLLMMSSDVLSNTFEKHVFLYLSSNPKYSPSSTFQRIFRKTLMLQPPGKPTLPDMTNGMGTPSKLTGWLLRTIGRTT
jgi:hypothetical protein